MPTFKRQERLKGKSLIRDLFESGKGFSVQPFRVIAIPVNATGDFSVQLGVSVPKRNVKKASSRNRIKRLVKEAFRQNKEILSKPLSEKEKKIAMMIIYNSGETLTYKETEDKIILILQRLSGIYGS